MSTALVLKKFNYLAKFRFPFCISQAISQSHGELKWSWLNNLGRGL